MVRLAMHREGEAVCKFRLPSTLACLCRIVLKGDYRTMHLRSIKALTVHFMLHASWLLGPHDAGRPVEHVFVARSMDPSEVRKHLGLLHRLATGRVRVHAGDLSLKHQGAVSF